MIQSNRVWKYSTIGLLAVLAVGFSFPQAFAHASSNVGHMFQHILDEIGLVKAKLDNTDYGLQAIKNAIDGSADQSSVDDLQTTADSIKATQYVPFTASTRGPFDCVPNAGLFDEDHILISSSEDMMITSVIIRPMVVLNPDDSVAVTFVNGIFISTGNLVPTGGTPSDDAFDIMTSNATFPHQIAGDSIDFTIWCDNASSGGHIVFEGIYVSGWKSAGEEVSVTYVE